MNKLLEIFTNAILLNELDGNRKAAYRFSDPDGVLSGKSGWSFGVCQYDINNNPSAILALREMEFTTDQIKALKAQTVKNMTMMNALLIQNTAIVDKWDAKQLDECLTVPMNLCASSGIVFDNDEARVHVADYHNQLYMSKGGKLHNFLMNMRAPIVPEMILAFKMKLPWGLKRPDDVHRRYNNIQKLFQEGT